MHLGWYLQKTWGWRRGRRKRGFFQTERREIHLHTGTCSSAHVLLARKTENAQTGEEGLWVWGFPRLILPPWGEAGMQAVSQTGEPAGCGGTQDAAPCRVLGWPDLCVSPCLPSTCERPQNGGSSWSWSMNKPWPSSTPSSRKLTSCRRWAGLGLGAWEEAGSALGTWSVGG